MADIFELISSIEGKNDEQASGIVNEIKLLLEEDSSLVGQEDHSITPLHLAVAVGSLDLVKLLVKHNAGVNKRLSEYYTLSKYNIKALRGDTPLQGAAFAGFLGIGQILIEAQAEIDDKESPVISAAIFNRHVDFVSFLIEKGAALNKRNEDGETPLHRSVQVYSNRMKPDDVSDKDWAERKIKIVRMLLDKKVEVNTKASLVYNSSNSPLHDATELEIVKLLIGAGADVNARNARRETPLHRVESGEVAELLISNQADINAVDKNYDSPLYYALKEGRKEVFEVLIAHNPEARSNRVHNIQIKVGVTKENVGAIKYLIEKTFAGLNISGWWPADNKYLPLLIWAIEKDLPDFALVLIEKGFSITSHMFDGRTALNSAIKMSGGSNKNSGAYSSLVDLIIDLLIGKRTISNVEDGNKSTFHFDRFDKSKSLAVLNAQDGEGNTPLHFAVIYRKESLVETLLKAGVDFDLVNKSGQRPYDLANSDNSTGISLLALFDLKKIIREEVIYKYNGGGDQPGQRNTFWRKNIVKVHPSRDPMIQELDNDIDKAKDKYDIQDAMIKQGVKLRARNKDGTYNVGWLGRRWSTYYIDLEDAFEVYVGGYDSFEEATAKRIDDAGYSKLKV